MTLLSAPLHGRQPAVCDSTSATGVPIACSTATSAPADGHGGSILMVTAMDQHRNSMVISVVTIAAHTGHISRS